jgi:hypothetical protein
MVFSSRPFGPVEHARFFAVLLTGFRSPRAPFYAIAALRHLVAARFAIARGLEAPLFRGEGVFIIGGDDDSRMPRYRDSVALSPQLLYGLRVSCVPRPREIGRKRRPR